MTYSSHLKASFIVLFSLVLGIASYGQKGNAEYKASSEGWLVNIKEAQALSVETKKPILANFTGSDWCGWCKRLKRDVFQTKEFKAWAKENVVLLELDFPRKFKLPAEIKEQNDQLQRALQVRSYPTIWVFTLEPNPETKQIMIQKLAKSGYQSSAKKWIKDISKQIATNRANLLESKKSAEK